MRKTNSIILVSAFLLVMACLCLSCGKKENFSDIKPKITETPLKVFATQATFSWEVVYPGKIGSMVEISLNEDMSQSTRYGSEEITDNKKFSVTVSELSEATTYYYRYIVWNPNTSFELETKSFSTSIGFATVTTAEVTDITRSTAKGGGEVTYESGSPVTERGLCWCEFHNPTINDTHLASGSGMGSFTVTMTNLEYNKTYYVRAYAKNEKGVAYGEEVSFITSEATQPIVSTLECSNVTTMSVDLSGNISDNGGWQICDCGFCFGIDPEPDINSHHISAGVVNSGNFQVTLQGLKAGESYYVRAYAKNSVGISYGEQKQLTTTIQPEGVLNGCFSIGENKYVQFSKGNLQYRASTQTWRLAENQWDYVGSMHIGAISGSGNENISQTYDGWIDLFGWGTSGWNNGNTYYQPWCTEEAETSYGPPGNHDLTGEYVNADWGKYISISNTTVQGEWRTPTYWDFRYLLDERKASTLNGVENARFAKGRIGGLPGIFIFPDYYYHPEGIALPEAINDYEAEDWGGNNYEREEWTILENAGVVFLPITGIRKGTALANIGWYGYYWTSTSNKDDMACMLKLESKLAFNYILKKSCGISVRLVYDVTP